MYSIGKDIKDEDLSKKLNIPRADDIWIITF